MFRHNWSVFIMNILDTDMSGYDLCLLTTCNHSIHTYGTYGAWGSLLAGGDVIAPTGTNPEANAEVSLKLLSYFINVCTEVHGQHAYSALTVYGQITAVL